MSASPKRLPKLSRDFKTMSPRILPAITITPTAKIPSISDTGLLSSQRGMASPSILLTSTDESPLPNNGTVSISNYGSKLEFLGQRGPRKSAIDQKTANYINLLVEDAYNKKTIKRKSEYISKNTLTSPKAQSRDHKILNKVETMIKHKGLDAGTRDRQFESRLEVFDQVKTYVDVKKLFNGVDNINSQIEATREQNMTPTINQLRPGEVPQDFTQQTPKSFQFSELLESPVGYKKKSSFFSKNIVDSSAGVTGTEENEEAAAVRAPRKSATLAVSPENSKALEIRKLYEQLKENALQKFGPGIFEKAQKKMKDPEQIKLLEKKRKEEIQEMRKLKHELGSLDLGYKLMDNLVDYGRKSADLQFENGNQFDNYVENNLEEDEVVLSARHKPPIVVIPPNREPRIEENKEDVLIDKPEDDNQIKLLKQLQHHKQKSDEVVKLLRDKIVSVQQKDALSDGCLSPGLNLYSPRRKSKYCMGTPGLSDVDSPSNNMWLTQTRDSPNIRPPTNTRNMLLKSALKLDLENFANESGSESSREEKSARQFPEISIRKKGRTSTLTVGTGKETPSMPFVRRKEKGNSSTVVVSSVVVQKSQLLGICSDLQDLATANKDFNKKARASIREVGNSFAVMAREEGEDILKSPAETGCLKSTSKLATSLATKIYLAKDTDLVYQ